MDFKTLEEQQALTFGIAYSVLFILAIITVIFNNSKKRKTKK